MTILGAHEGDPPLQPRRQPRRPLVAPSSRGLFNQSPEKRARGTSFARASSEEQQFFQDERERAARQAAVQSRRVVTQRARVDELLATTPRNAPAAELAKVEAAQARYNAARKSRRSSSRRRRSSPSRSPPRRRA
jgi:hypothetical protein